MLFRYRARAKYGEIENVLLSCLAIVRYGRHLLGKVVLSDPDDQGLLVITLQRHT